MWREIKKYFWETDKVMKLNNETKLIYRFAYQIEFGTFGTKQVVFLAQAKLHN